MGKEIMEEMFTKITSILTEQKGHKNIETVGLKFLDIFIFPSVNTNILWTTSLERIGGL